MYKNSHLLIQKTEDKLIHWKKELQQQETYG
jgi:hypothetical protein